MASKSKAKSKASKTKAKAAPKATKSKAVSKASKASRPEESSLRPLHDRLIVRREDEERTSAGGIMIPDSATEKPMQGKVLAVGHGKMMPDGTTRVPEVCVGDMIMFGKYAGTEVKLEGEELVVMREEDVIAVLEG